MFWSGSNNLGPGWIIAANVPGNESAVTFSNSHSLYATTGRFDYCDGLVDTTSLIELFYYWGVEEYLANEGEI